MLRRALVATIVLLASTLPSTALNDTSRALMNAPEARRNAVFLMILRSTNDRCDEVIRTQYNDSVGDSDDWEAKCRDGGHYSFSIYGDPKKQTKVLSCAELAALAILFKTKMGCFMK